MAAHGYGLASTGSPNLIFSNVLWGHLVRLMPEINAIPGYSIATLGVLFAVGTTVFYGLRRLGVDSGICLTLLVLILARPVLFPQFTINAGMLMIGAIVCWQVYAQDNQWRMLMAGCLFAFVSYLVRSQMFFLVFIAALPLLPWTTLRLHRITKIAYFTLAIAITIAAVIDHHAYQNHEWHAFNELNSVRAAFTDFGADSYLKQHPDILQRYGYSQNDIDLIRHWFFVDPEIVNPKIMSAMLAEMGHIPASENALINVWKAIKTLWHPNLLPMLLAALLMATLRPSWRTGVIWGLCIAAILIFGLAGRPGILRIYIPLVSLLLITPLLIPQTSTLNKRLQITALLVAAFFNFSKLIPEVKTTQLASQQIRNHLVNFPDEAVVIWGGSFPFEAVYPVLGAASSAMKYRFYSLGVFTLAPFSLAFTGQQTGHGMIERLVDEQGVPIIANKQRFNYLDIYCNEHLHGQLKELTAEQYGEIAISWRQCEVGR